jgi:hypothetical protein
LSDAYQFPLEVFYEPKGHFDRPDFTFSSGVFSVDHRAEEPAQRRSKKTGHEEERRQRRKEVTRTGNGEPVTPEVDR